jgi:hypothetical protein
VQQADYEKALLVAACFQLAQSNDVNELLAIACTLRNWVVGRYGQGQQTYRTYSECINNFLAAYPVRQLPDSFCPALIDPTDGLLAKIDAVFDNTLADVTSSKSHPGGARYFGSARNPDSWFKREILERQDVHSLLGTWGAMQFFA